VVRNPKLKVKLGPCEELCEATRESMEKDACWERRGGQRATAKEGGWLSRGTDEERRGAEGKGRIEASRKYEGVEMKCQVVREVFMAG
jgi:hypothetical protein